MVNKTDILCNLKENRILKIEHPNVCECVFIEK